MKKITLSDLPDPPTGKIGWPWTECSDQLPMRMNNGDKWPKISVITPSYNYGQYIEETIRSVLLQGYPNLEYIVVDGCSSDDTKSVLSKYKAYIDVIISEKDEGLGDALLKGFDNVTGQWVGWQNADDFYAKNAFKRFVNSIVSDEGIGIYYGATFAIDCRYKCIEKLIMLPILQGYRFSDFPFTGPPNQSAMLRVATLRKYGFVDKKYKYAMDTELMSRLLLCDVKSFFSHGLDGYYRIHDNALTFNGGEGSAQEACDVCISALSTNNLTRQEWEMVLRGFYRLLKRLYRSKAKAKFLKYSTVYLNYRLSPGIILRCMHVKLLFWLGLNSE